MSAKKEQTTTDRLRRNHPPTRPRSLEKLGPGPGPGPAPTHLIVIGASAGGHTAVKEVIRGLSDNLPAAVILIRHLPALVPSQYGTMHMENWLHDVTRAQLRLISEGDHLESGVIYLTPPGMSVTIDRQRFKLTPYPERPAPSFIINALFESAAREYGNRIIGVILTGMLVDGTLGLRAVHEAGGLTVVQDPTDAEYPSMPRSAMKDLPVTFCLNLAEIGPALDLLVRRTIGLETGLAVSARMLKQRVALLGRLMQQSKQNEQTLGYLSSEMQLLKYELKEIQTLLHQATG